MCKLIEIEQIGDRTSSRFYRHLRNFAISSTLDDFILTVWEDRLPVHMQEVLRFVEDKNPETRIQIADRIHEIRPKEGRIVAVSEHRTTKNSERQNHGWYAMEGRLNRVEDVLDTRLNQILTRIDALSIDNHRRSRP